VLTFVLTMMAVMSMLHAFRNLRTWRYAPDMPMPCSVVIPRILLHFNNRSKLSHYQLCLVQTVIRFGATSSASLTSMLLHYRIPKSLFRSCLPARLVATGRLTLYTEFPLGCFTPGRICISIRASGLMQNTGRRAMPAGNSPDGTGKRQHRGDDDFSGCANMPKAIALPAHRLEAMRRERGLQVKQFTTPLGEELWLDFSDAPDRSEEEKLARMTRWVAGCRDAGSALRAAHAGWRIAKQ